MIHDTIQIQDLFRNAHEANPFEVRIRSHDTVQIHGLGTIVFNNAARKNYRHNDAIEDEFRTMFGNADLKPETY